MYIPVAQCMKFVHKCDLCDVLTWSVDSSYSDAFGSMPYTCIYSLHSKVCILFINFVSIKQSQLKNPIKIRSFLFDHGVVTFDILKLNENRSDLSCRCS